MRKGAFLVEMVIILPILFLLLAWIFLIGKILHTKQVVLLAARAGAQYAVTPDNNFGKMMATFGILPTLTAGKGKEAEEVVKEVLKNNGLNPERANISYSSFYIPFPPLEEQNVKNVGKQGRATVHSFYNDMSAEGNHYNVIREELKNVFDKNQRYQYTKYSIPCYVWLVKFDVEYKIDLPILKIVNGLLKAAGFEEEIKEFSIKGSCTFPAPMSFTEIVANTPPLRKVWEVQLWQK